MTDTQCTALALPPRLQYIMTSTHGPVIDYLNACCFWKVFKAELKLGTF